MEISTSSYKHCDLLNLTGRVDSATAPQFNAGFGMADIEIGAGRAHGAEGAGGNHVHLFSRLFNPFLFGDLNYFSGGDYHRVAKFDFLVDFLNRLRHCLSQIID